MNENNGAKPSADDKFEKVESGIKSIERFFVILGVLVVFLLIGWRVGGENGNNIMLIGGCLIAVLVMVEILLIERTRRHN